MTAPSEAERRERRRNLLFLTTPRLWPEWPFLPLVRRSLGREVEYGLLYDVYRHRGRTGYGATVFLCNYFLRPDRDEDLLALPREVHDTAEEVFAAGWRVD
jgi:hypothetical protein